MKRWQFAWKSASVLGNTIQIYCRGSPWFTCVKLHSSVRNNEQLLSWYPPQRASLSPQTFLPAFLFLAPTKEICCYRYRVGCINCQGDQYCYYYYCRCSADSEREMMMMVVECGGRSLNTHSVKGKMPC